VPIHDDHRHFEMLILEGAQAGLSWSTILLRREGYRKAFSGFDPVEVARFDSRKQAALLNNTGIIRNRLKIKSAITNAQAFLKVQEEFGSFDIYIWQFVGGKPRINNWAEMSHVPATTPESDALSKDLKKRGFSFVGSTVLYAHMQAAGLVNDHTTDCFRHPTNRKPQSSRQKTSSKVASSLFQTGKSRKPQTGRTIDKNKKPLNMIPHQKATDFGYLLIDSGQEVCQKSQPRWICGVERRHPQLLYGSGSTMRPVGGKNFLIAMQPNWINSQRSSRNSEMLRVGVG